MVAFFLANCFNYPTHFIRLKRFAIDGNETYNNFIHVSKDGSNSIDTEACFAPDGRHAFFAAADGWVVKFELWPLRLAAQAQVGTALRAIALSGDGRWLLAGNAAPRTAVLLDTDLRAVKTFALQTLDGRRDSRVADVLDVAPRRSFVVAL